MHRQRAQKVSKNPAIENRQLPLQTLRFLTHPAAQRYAEAVRNVASAMERVRAQQPH